MEISLGLQSLRLLRALLLGLGTGLLYDLLRPLRRAAGIAAAAGLDALKRNICPPFCIYME